MAIDGRTATFHCEIWAQNQQASAIRSNAVDTGMARTCSDTKEGHFRCHLNLKRRSERMEMKENGNEREWE